MKILMTGHFDPCGVGLRQRRYLRDLGVDFRLAVERVYWPEGFEADWWLEHPEGADEASLHAFAQSADLVVHCPAIHQYWSYDAGERARTPEEDAFPVQFKAKRMAYLFHGSVNLAENLDAYRGYYSRSTRLATTLDYADSLHAEYVPSIVETTFLPAAKLRESALTVVHAPSDPRVCQSEMFYSICRDLGIEFEKVQGVSHEMCLERKAKHPAGYDHVRGAFSVNSLENAGLGLVNLVGTRPDYWAKASEHCGADLPWPKVQGMADVASELKKLRQDFQYCCDMQAQARQWSIEHWSPTQVAERILAVYEKAAA